MTRPFLDTNILVYAFGADQRSAVAQHILEQGGCIAVQSLNEFVRVVISKQGWTWSDARGALAEIESLCEPPIPMDLAVQRTGLALAEQYKLHIFDAALVAAALASDCDIFYSEDMHNGLMIDGRLRIVNPFV